jgi:chemotaxis signal transduction protein
MSYEHITVARINKDTADYIERFDTRVVSTTEEADKIFTDNTRLIDGVYVSKKLGEFCDAILKANRHVKFGIAKRIKGEFIHGTNRQALAEVWVYMPEHEYAMMRVGFADYAVKGNMEGKFGVYSRLLQNDKFNSDRDQYYMVTSDNLERIMKTVKKVMRPYAPHEVANVVFDNYQNKVHNNVWTATSTTRDAKDAVMGLNDLRNELFALYDLGYEFASEVLKDKIGKWKKAVTEMTEAEAKKRDAYFVSVVLRGDELLCNVMTVDNVRRVHKIDEKSMTQTFKMEDLPEDIAEKVATLGMVDKGHYVEDVGMKVSDTTFWVDRT